MKKFCSHMTAESRDVIILVAWSKFFFQKCDVSKIMSSKIYKLSIFEIYNQIPS